MNLFESIDAAGNISYFNPKYLMYVDKAKNGSEIVVQGGMAKVFWDKREPETIVALLKQFKP